MKRVLGVALALMLPAAFLVACGGGDSADSTSTTSKTSAEKSGSDSKDSDTKDSDSGSGSDSGSSGSSTGNEKVDKYCDDVKALAEKSKKALEDRDSDLAKEIGDDAADLSKQATGLAAEVMKDPSLAQAITDCSKELSDIVPS